MIAALALAVAFAQEPPTISATTRLVEVSVVVTDRKGKPVTDLSQTDFELLENGRIQPVRFFFRESGENNRTDRRTATPSLPPGVFSNNGGPGAASSRAGVTILLFDALNTPWQYRNYAGQHLNRFTKAVPPGERLVTLLLSPAGLRLLQNDLRYRLADFRSDALLAQGETSAEVQQADRYTDDRVRTTLRALEAIAANASGVAGRKNLIWITGGIPTQLNLFEPPGSLRDRASYSAEYRFAMLALNRANVAVYPVDARGLEAMPATKLAFGPQDRYQAMPTPEALQKYQQYREGMRELATGTGGKAYFDRNDLERSMTEANEDARASYTLAYYRPGEDDGKWRKIQVRVKRENVSVRHRTGYLPLPETADSNAALRRAIESPLDTTSIGLNGAVERQAGGTAQAMIQIDPGTVAFSPEGKAYRYRLQVVSVIRDAGGKTVGKAQMDRLDALLEGKSLQDVQANGILFRKQLPGIDNGFFARFAVLDPLTGLIGTLSIPLTPPGSPALVK